MAKRMLIDAVHSDETRVVIVDNNQIYDYDFISSSRKPLKGNIYLAKVTRVEPSLQAAFVEYGGGKQGFLPFSEIHTDYYQIPVSDREKLMAEAAREEKESEPVKKTRGRKPKTTKADTPTDESDPELETTPVPEDEANKDSTTQKDTSKTSADKTEDDSRPAYLMQQASTDVSSSEEIEESQDSTTTKDADEKEDETETEAEADNQEDNSDNDNKTDVETLATEEEEAEAVRTRSTRNIFMKRYKIQEVLRRGQIVLVQVIKEERGNKGVSLTTYLSLAGRYCVLMPNSPKDGGISRKIASTDDRKRLKAISTELKLSQGMSVIIRTAGMERTRTEIKRDFDYLVKLWNNIREDTLKASAPAIIYEESDIIKRAIRDQYNNDIEQVVIEGSEAYKSAKDFMKLLLPSHTPKIKEYKDTTPIFYANGDIEDQLMSMHDPIVKLKSGGYIVINPTEALISIDVNSGRATTERNIEETAVKTNLEAATEVARQLRLRDLAGLVVIDFIDMSDSRNRRSVEKTLKDALKVDRAKIQLGRISPFGLLEMSRQRLGSSISESNMVQCPHCSGHGFVRSNDSMSLQIIRALSKEASAGTWGGLRLIASQSIALHLLNTKRDALRGIEERYNINIHVLINNDLPDSEYNLEKMRRPQSERNESNNRPKRDRNNDRNKKPRKNTNTAKKEESTEKANTDTSTEEKKERRTRRPRRTRTQNTDANTSKESAATEKENVAQATNDNNQETAKDQPDKPASNRRQRGGRRRNVKENSTVNTDKEETKAKKPETAQKKQSSDNDDANALPAFATREAVKDQPVVPKKKEAVAVNTPTSTPRDPNSPPKKGWWQKMIDLDE